MATQMLTTGNVSRGIHRSLQIGEQIARNHPEISDEFRDGKTLRELAFDYSPDYKISESVAINSIYNALQMLMSSEELRRISKEHIRTNSRRVMEILNRTMNKVEVYEKGLGKLSKSELHANGRRAAISRGLIPFELNPRNTGYGKMNEPEYVFFLKDEAFQEYSWREIALEVNEVFDNNRTPRTLQVSYQRWKGK
jgi:hypothetical protein